MPRDTPEIGPERVRRKRADTRAFPTSTPPAFANTEIGGDDASGDGGAKSRSEPKTVAPHIPNIVTELAALQRRRKFCIKQQSQSARSIESFIASTMGFRIDATEKDRKALFARAKAFRLSVERGGEGQPGSDTHTSDALSAIAPMALISATNREPWDELRGRIEKEMVTLAKQLPVYPWAKAINGFGDKGLAIICGEAGIPIGEYRTVEGLWKRMGLAVIDGERQRKKTDATQAAAHGYSPKRRAEIWTLADSMFRHQWAGDKDKDGKNPEKTGKPTAVPAHPTGSYGEEYAARRAHTEPRIAATADLSPKDPEKWTLGRCNNDARRVMSKALLRDLWIAWRAADRA